MKLRRRSETDEQKKYWAFIDRTVAEVRRNKTMSEQERPEWAKEFEGWRMLIDNMHRKTNSGMSMEISSGGWLWVQSNIIYLPSPEAALRVANCIAKELGGWPGEES